MALAVGRTPYFSPRWTLPLGFLSILMTMVGFPKSERSQSTRRKPRCLLRSSLESHTPSHLHCCKTLLVSQVVLAHCGRTHKGRDSRRWGFCGGHILEASYPGTATPRKLNRCSSVAQLLHETRENKMKCKEILYLSL